MSKFFEVEVKESTFKGEKYYVHLCSVGYNDGIIGHFEYFNNRKEAIKYAESLQRYFNKVYQFLDTQYFYLQCVYNRNPLHYEFNQHFGKISDARAFCVFRARNSGRNHFYNISRYINSMINFLVFFRKYQPEICEFQFQILQSFYEHFENSIKCSRSITKYYELELFLCSLVKR